MACINIYSVFRFECPHNPMPCCKVFLRWGVSKDKSAIWAHSDFSVAVPQKTMHDGFPEGESEEKKEKFPVNSLAVCKNILTFAAGIIILSQK